MLSAACREQSFAILTSSDFWPDFHIETAAFREALDAIVPFNVTAGLRCFYSTYAGQRGKQRWGDKTPTYGVLMNAIQSILPEAHFIHIIRDPRGVALSFRNRERWKRNGNPVANAANIWHRIVMRTRMQARACHSYMEVRYEDLVADPEAQIKRICVFLDLPYAACVLPAVRATRLDPTVALRAE